MGVWPAAGGPAGLHQLGQRRARARPRGHHSGLVGAAHHRRHPLALDRAAHAGIDQYLAAAGRGHLDATRAAWPMWVAGQAFGKEFPNNVGLLPYHFRCRTVTVAYLGRVDAQGRPLPDAEAGIYEVDVWRGMNWQREPLDRRDLGRLIERALMARWDNGAYARRHLDCTSRRQAGRPACAMKLRWNRAARREEFGDGSFEDRCAAPAGLRGAFLF